MHINFIKQMPSYSSILGRTDIPAPPPPPTLPFDATSKSHLQIFFHNNKKYCRVSRSNEHLNIPVYTRLFKSASSC